MANKGINFSISLVGDDVQGYKIIVIAGNKTHAFWYKDLKLAFGFFKELSNDPAIVFESSQDLRLELGL